MGHRVIDVKLSTNSNKDTSVIKRNTCMAHNCQVLSKLWHGH